MQAYITRQLIRDKEVLYPKQGLIHDTNWDSYFEILHLLFIPGQVQRIHQFVRSEQLRRASCPCKPPSSSRCVSCLIQWCVQSLAKDVAMRPSLGIAWHDCLTAAEGTLSVLLASQVASQAKAGDSGDKAQHFLDAVFNVLVLCDGQEGELSSVLHSVIEKSDGWREFESSSLAKPKSERAWWYQCLQNLLLPYLKSVVVSLTTPIFRSACEKSCSWLHQMWDELEQHSKTASNNLQGHSLLVELLSCTMAVVPTFPAPLLACLTRLGAGVAKVGVLPTKNSAGLQVLVSTLHDILKCPQQLDELFGSRLDSRTNLECARIADEIVAHALLQTQHSRDEPPARLECDQRAVNCLDLLAGLLNAEMDVPWEEGISQAAEDITLGLVAEQLLRTPQGQDNISYLHTVLCCNEAWIRHTLAIPPADQAPLPSQHLLNLNCSRKTKEPKFNPLETYTDCLQVVQNSSRTQSP
ncbi:hypothetical protein V5799_022446 [Amblyomma americanum]|uniref:Uncharacterized protein n=1 Tax=Amblyomma americanum TaxID=6943 RepID=A0AAQ4FKH7_AMBAM